MAATAVVTLKIEVLSDDKFYQVERDSRSFSYTISGNVVSLGNVAVLAASTAQQIASFSAAPTFLYVLPDVAGTLAWGGSTGADNASIECAAGKPILLAGVGQLTADAASAETRAEASAVDITQLWFDADSNGEVFIAAFR